MKKLIGTTIALLCFSLYTPEAVESRNRVEACLAVDCGILGNSYCGLSWWPNSDGTAETYWCVKIDVEGLPPGDV